MGRITADHLDMEIQVACFKAHRVERLGSLRVAVYTPQLSVVIPVCESFELRD
jgi:hypothetical protein